MNEIFLKYGVKGMNFDRRSFGAFVLVQADCEDIAWKYPQCFAGEF
jgi:hypothetical protein